MDIFVNNQKHSFDNISTLQGVVDSLGLQTAKGVAIAVNNQIAPKSKWSEFTLKPDDKVTIIKATQGG